MHIASACTWYFVSVAVSQVPGHRYEWYVLLEYIIGIYSFVCICIEMHGHVCMCMHMHMCACVGI